MRVEDTIMSIENTARRIKKHIHAQLHSFEISAPPGFVDVCERWVHKIVKSSQIANLQQTQIKKKASRIRIDDAPFDLCHDLLLQGSLFSEVKIRIHRVRCSSAEKLFKLIEGIQWNLWLPEEKNIKFDIKVNSIKSKLYNENQIKKQIYSHLKKMFPCNEELSLPVALEFNLEKETLEIFLSLGSKNYWQRGHKQTLKHAAPLREDIAACLIARLVELNASWKIQAQPSIIINSFCGTGTLLHESALFLNGTGHFTSAMHNWTYLQLPFFKTSTFEHAKKTLLKKTNIGEKSDRADIKPIFIGEDLDSTLTNATLSWFNSVNNPSNNFEVSCFCRDSSIPPESEPALAKNEHGWILANPPFGLRLSTSTQGGTDKIYSNFSKRISKMLAKAHQNSSCWSGVLLCPTPETWLIASRNLKGWKQKCEHFTLGGKDIRAFYFSSLKS